LCAGQKGIISAFAFNPDYSGLYAAGSYDSSICLYAENQQSYVQHLNPQAFGGVTCLKWSPCGQYVWAGGRRCNSIVCYDIRNTRDELGRYVINT
jgi:WD40 repeat protein